MAPRNVPDKVRHLAEWMNRLNREDMQFGREVYRKLIALASLNAQVPDAKLRGQIEEAILDIAEEIDDLADRNQKLVDVGTFLQADELSKADKIVMDDMAEAKNAAVIAARTVVGQA